MLISGIVLIFPGIDILWHDVLLHLVVGLWHLHILVEDLEIVVKLIVKLLLVLNFKSIRVQQFPHSFVLQCLIDCFVIVIQPGAWNVIPMIFGVQLLNNYI